MREEQVRKSLTDLIDDTLLELEELKKSRYAAAEADLKGPGEGIAGKPSNGDLHAKAEDKKDDEEDEDKKKEKEAMKAEGQNRQADPDGGKHKAPAGEGMEHGQGPDKGMSGGKSHGNGKNAEADPGDTHHEGAGVEKADKEDKKKDKKEPHEDDPHHEEKEKKMAEKLLAMHKGELKKSKEESDALMKSFVEERVKPLEDKLSTILDLVNKIAEQPVSPKGATSRAVPLLKSADEATESLSKSDVASKLFELKKSGAKVDSLDITRAEMGHDLQKIVEKYKIS